MEPDWWPHFGCRPATRQPKAKRLFMRCTWYVRILPCMKNSMQPLGILTAIWIALNGSQPTGATTGAPQSATPAQVTTDTAAYCTLLGRKMDSERGAAFDAIALDDQGKALCARGEIRAGIAQLRRALLTMRAENQMRTPEFGAAATTVDALNQSSARVGSDGVGVDADLFQYPGTATPASATSR